MPGRDEFELFAEIRQALEAEAGQRLVLDSDLLTGAIGTASVMGGPSPRLIEEGDPVLCDLAPTVSRILGRRVHDVLAWARLQELVELFDVVKRTLATGE